MRLSAPTAGASGAQFSAAIAGARCGQPFDAQVQPSAGCRVVAMRVDATLGLLSDPAQPGRLHGTPLRTGTFALDVTLEDARGQRRSVTVMLHVSPDPRSMWKDLPCDPQAPFAKPSLASEQLRLAQDVRLLGVSCRGRMHANVGGFRDDDFAIGELPGQRLALIAADGAGSAVLSREGSRLAVNAALNSLTAASASTPEQQLGAAARAALDAITAQAAASRRALGDFSTTLLIAVCDLAAPHEITVMQIGDGLIAALSADGQWSGPLGIADHGDFHGQTRFLSAECLTPQHLAARIRRHRLGQLRYLLVATDGITDPSFETDEALLEPSQWLPFIGELDRAVSAGCGPLQGLQRWLEAFTPGHHDDRTLALAYWPSAH